MKKILIKPLINEKSLKQVETLNAYTFEVEKESNKKEIKRMIEEMFNVKVLKINTKSIKGKRVVWRRKNSGSRKDKKIAVAVLKSSDSINLFKVK